MSRAIKVCIVLAVVWSGYWFVSGYGARQGLSAWFQAQEARGWQTEFTEIKTTGYPLRHVTTLSNPALADPATGAAWQADTLGFDSPAIWPGHLTLQFSDAPQRLSYFDQTVTLTAAEMLADLRLQPGLALELERMALTAGPWSLVQDKAELIGADNLVLAMQQTDQADTYQFDVAARAFTPGARLRDLGRISETLPPAFETLEMDLEVQFDRPWDRSALETARPQPRRIALKLADAKWGALRVLVAGNVTVDQNGVPEGAMTIKAENWRDMLAMAQQTGALPPEALGPVERVLNLLSGISGNPNALDVQLNLLGGFVALGPFPLGPAPRLILR
jgi:hypothetical protein